ncbi:hypothetical protein KR038_000671 [Drosophila bunnanda]|nr:hypothetical protein KR038_000671 [Drosophila bunnanda]
MDSAEEDANATKRLNHHFRIRWSKEMEQLVVDLWEQNIDDYFGARKRRLIYKEMAETISAAGLAVKWTDVRNKIENLTRKYRIEKDKVISSQGGSSRWQHFEKIHSLLSGVKLGRPQSQASIKEEVVEDDFKASLTDVETNVDTQTELLVIAREQLQIQREEQIFNREHRRAQLKVLKYIARSQDRLHSLLIQLLTDTNDDDI